MNNGHKSKLKLAWPLCTKSLTLKQKLHTCKEGGAHLRISFWHLLMNFEKPKKNQYFEKMKKIAGGIIILQMCTKKRYSSWDKSEKECFVILGHFSSFYPHTYTHTHTHTHTWSNKKHMMYAYSGMECNRQFFVILGHFLFFYPLLTPKIKIWKNVKNTWRYYPFTHVYHKLR